MEITMFTYRKPEPPTDLERYLAALYECGESIF